MFYENIHNLYVINPSLNQKKVVFYGGGVYSHALYRTMIRGGISNLIGIYDNNMQGGMQFGNVKMLSRSEFEALEKDTPVIIATKHMEAFQEMAHDLLKLGFQDIYTNLWPAMARPYDLTEAKKILEKERGNFEEARALLADEDSKKVFDTILQYRLTNDYRLFFQLREKSYPQYFPKGEIFAPEDNEIFIDAGSLNALTVCDFKEWTQDKYCKAYCFEPSPEDKVVVDEMIDFYKLRALSVGAGLYDHNRTVKFSTDNIGGSAINSAGSLEIQTVKLDDFMKDKNEKVTFIKMDIEGSELKALEGAEEIIRCDHPKLAICVYHKFNDIWEIPLWLHKKFPRYEFYLRHHSITNNETVLYAKWK